MRLFDEEQFYEFGRQLLECLPEVQDNPYFYKILEERMIANYPELCDH